MSSLTSVRWTTFATNVTAVYYTTVAFLDLLHQGNVRKQPNETPSLGPTPQPPFHASQVISISSSGAFRVDSKILSMSYTLSKAACTHLGKTMANLLSPWGIRSNVLAPGVWPSGTLRLRGMKVQMILTILPTIRNVNATSGRCQT